MNEIPNHKHFTMTFIKLRVIELENILYNSDSINYIHISEFSNFFIENYLYYNIQNI